MVVPTKNQARENFKKRKWWSELGKTTKDPVKVETEEEKKKRKENMEHILSIFKDLKEKKESES